MSVKTSPAELLKERLMGSWSSFSDQDLYRVFCLLIDQIESLEKQNKSLKKGMNGAVSRATPEDMGKIELLKSNIGRDILQIVEETERLLSSADTVAKKIQAESEILDKKQQGIKQELMGLLGGKPKR